MKNKKYSVSIVYIKGNEVILKCLIVSSKNVNDAIKKAQSYLKSSDKHKKDIEGLNPLIIRPILIDENVIEVIS